MTKRLIIKCYKRKYSFISLLPSLSKDIYVPKIALIELVIKPESHIPSENLLIILLGYKNIANIESQITIIVLSSVKLGDEYLFPPKQLVNWSKS